MLSISFNKFCGTVEDELCRLYSGLKLGEIGAAYGVAESAVTQASRRVAEEMKTSKSARESIGQLERDLRASRV